MIKCHKCGKKAVIHQKYSGMFLCRDHFQADVHRKVRESIRKTFLFGRGVRVAVALGGDKKSATLEEYVRLLYDQALVLEGSKPKDPGAFSKLIAKLMVNNAEADTN